jgi:phosphoglycerate dehydrogenase-like enzyme
MSKKNLFLLLTALLAASGVLAQERKKVIVMSRMGPELARRLQAAVPEVAVIVGDQEKTNEQLADADGFIGNFNANMVRSAPKLRWVQRENAGVENLTFSAEFRNSQITLTSCKILQGWEIADHAMGLIICGSDTLPIVR